MEAHELQQALVQTRQALAVAQEKGNRALTWHNLAQLAAKVMLALAFCLWFRAQWAYIGPHFSMTIDGILAAGLDIALVAGLAFANATVPPIFWSSLVPSTPANTLLARLYARYSLPGFVFVCASAIVFTLYSYDVLLSYYQSREFVVAIGGTEVYKQALIALFLMIGFPAWALNKMTPEQWVDAVTQAREVSRIQRAIELEEGVFRALHARAIALFQADVTDMTIEQLRARNVEAATIMATFARAEQRALRNVAETFRSLYGMELQVPSLPDADVTEKFRAIALALNDGAGAHKQTADHGELVRQQLAAPAPAAAPAVDVTPTKPRLRSFVQHQDAETGDRTSDHERPQATAARSTADRGRTKIDLSAGDRDALAAARKALGQTVWKRRDLEEALPIQKSAANNLINAWRDAGVLVNVSYPRNSYQFVEEV